MRRIAAKEAAASDATCDTSAAIRCLLAFLFEFETLAYLGDAAKWVGGNRENVGRCCRCNQSRKRLKNPWGHPSDKVNTDHKYMGIRFYFESDNVWTTKITTP